MKGFFVFIVCVGLSGCMTQKKVTGYLDDNQPFASGYCKNKYPLEIIKTVVDSSSLKAWRDSLRAILSRSDSIVEEPKAIQSIDTTYMLGVDLNCQTSNKNLTIENLNLKRKIQYVYDNPPPPVIINNTEKDSVGLVNCQTVCNEKVNRLEKQLTKETKNKNIFKGISIGTGSIIGLLLGVIFFLLKRKTK